MRWDRREPQICSYCGKLGLSEREHVIAKQFFPANGLYRGDLIIVPACTECNREKGRVEEVVSIFLPYVSSSAAAKMVFEERITSTLRKNERLKNIYLKSIRITYGYNEFGKLIKISRFDFDDETQQYFPQWAEFVIRGLYREHAGENVPTSHQAKIRRFVKSEHVKFWRDWVNSHFNSFSAVKAKGEVRYQFSLGNTSVSSAWIINVYDTTIFALTHDVQDTALLKQIEEFAVQSFFGG